MLGEDIGRQALQEQTGLDWTPLQNGSCHGADEIAIDPESQTIWVGEIKSSQNGLDAAAAAGDPAARLDGWITKATQGTGDWANAGQADFAEQIQTLIDNGYNVKGIQVQVSVPVPGTTAPTRIRFGAW